MSKTRWLALAGRVINGRIVAYPVRSKKK